MNPLNALSPIVITPGEPAGIGPDIVCKLVASWDGHPLVIVACPKVMASRAAALNLPWQIPLYSDTKNVPVSLLPIDCPNAEPIPGVLNVDHASYVLATLEKATQGCLSGQFSALITGPVHKGILCDAGHAFTGHTEWLQTYSQTQTVLMTFLNPIIPCALLTTHLPLKEVVAHITHDRVCNAIHLLHTSMKRYYQLPAPKIGIAGINPHAGEGGHLGDEEQRVLIPAIRACQAQGIACSNPIPADTLFTPPVRREFDAILSIYHDQGLPVIKALAFGKTTQVSFGLPFLRVSVDHGTALSIAGSGKANHNSLALAVKAALALLDIKETIT